MATAALLLSKSYKSVAAFTRPAGGFGISQCLVILHTGNDGIQNAVSNINRIKDVNKNVMLLHTGNSLVPQPLLRYDVLPDDVVSSAFKIIYKGDIKVGIINKTLNHFNSSQVDETAAHLKNNKHCDLVVYLSDLGFKDDKHFNDRKLAAESTYIDIIISSHPQNFSKRPFVALNKIRQEVIISHSAGNAIDLGSFQIDFDSDRRKKKIYFHGKNFLS